MESFILPPEPSSWLGQYYVIPLCIAGLLVLLSLQKLTHHSGLRLPPGPRGLPLIGHLHLLGKLPHQSLEKLAKEFGPIMLLRMGFVNQVVISSSDLAKEVLKTQDRNFSSRPFTIVGNVFSFKQQDIIFSPIGEEWRLMRRICTNELLSLKRIAESQDVRRAESVKLVGRLLEEGHEGKLVTVDERVGDTVFNIMSRMVLQKGILGSEASISSQVKNLRALTKRATTQGFFLPGEFIPFLRPLDLGGKEARLRSLFVEYDKVLSTMLEEARNRAAGLGDQSSEGHSLMDSLLSVQKEEPEYRITDGRIKCVLQNMLIAGSDTNAHQTMWTLAELMRNPEIRQKALEELDSVVGRERLVTDADLANLTYLQAVVKESFRLHPVAPLMLPHESIVATRVAGFDIPAKTRLLVNVYAIMRDPKLWENPHVFNPDRFLKVSRDYGGQDFDFLPFGSGRRMCAGYRLGVAMVELNTAQLLHACEFRLPPGMAPQQVDIEEEFGTTVPRVKRLQLLITTRLPARAYAAAGLDLTVPAPDH